MADGTPHVRRYDEVLADLQAKFAAVAVALEPFPEAAAAMRAAINGATVTAEVIAGEAEDAARANALSASVAAMGAALAAIAPDEDTPPEEEEPSAPGGDSGPGE